MRVVDAVRPLAHRLGHRVLQRRRAAGDGHHLRAKQAHAVDVQRLADGVLLAHVDHTFQIHQRRSGRRRDAVLSRAGLRDQARFAHLFGEQRLTQHIVDLVRAGVVEVFPLEVNLRAAEFTRHLPRKIQSAGSARVVV